jgi:N-acetylglucosamine malate deacetylase 1
MRVLTIAPHPDDETLGCGGTLLKHKSAGDEIFWLIVTQGFEPVWSNEVIQQKSGEIDSVSAAYGFSKTIKLGFPSTRLDAVATHELISGIGDSIRDIQPGIVYLNHAGDIHSDHRVIFDATMSALKPFNTHRHGVRRILSYEVLSSTDAMPPNASRAFIPSVFNDISPFLEQKLRIMAEFKSEIHSGPFPRSLENIRALATYRGSTIGCEFAEAFMLIREVS